MFAFFTHFVNFLDCLRFACLNLQPLELRTQLRPYCLLKILNNLSSIDKYEIFTFHTSPVCFLNSIPLIQKPQSAINRLLSSFRYRSVDCWNSLPYVKNANSLNSFNFSQTVLVFFFAVLLPRWYAGIPMYLRAQSGQYMLMCFVRLFYFV